MKVTRMELDGVGSPMAIVAKILKFKRGLMAPIPIEDLATQLDIQEIADLETDGFEGGLLTDDVRSSGIILVNRAALRGRRRFTIAHELGHFLIPTHRPKAGAEFLCSRSDMRHWELKEKDSYARMEAEANEFASLLLMPPPLWRKAVDRSGDPNLGKILQLARDFDVSKEAAARAYARHHDQRVAIIVAKDGKINRVYTDPIKFPALSVAKGQPVPATSILFKIDKTSRVPSALNQARSEAWLQSKWGQRMPELYEQVLPQETGYALIMLWAEVAEEDEDYDPDAERTSKERYKDRLFREQ